MYGYKNKKDTNKQVIFGVVAYADIPTTQSTTFTLKELRVLSQQFVMRYLLGEAIIDIQHNRVPIEAFPFISFVTGETPSNGLPPKAWMLGVKVKDSKVWQDLKQGTLNAFSVDIMAMYKETVREYRVPKLMTGLTEPDPYDGHTHAFVLQIDPETQRILHGNTSKSNGHSHVITGYTSTDNSFNHNHRYYTVYER